MAVCETPAEARRTSDKEEESMGWLRVSVGVLALSKVFGECCLDEEERESLTFPHRGCIIDMLAHWPQAVSLESGVVPRQPFAISRRDCPLAQTQLNRHPMCFLRDRKPPEPPVFVLRKKGRRTHSFSRIHPSHQHARPIRPATILPASQGKGSKWLFLSAIRH